MAISFCLKSTLRSNTFFSVYSREHWVYVPVTLRSKYRNIYPVRNEPSQLFDDRNSYTLWARSFQFERTRDLNLKHRILTRSSANLGFYAEMYWVIFV